MTSKAASLRRYCAVAVLSVTAFIASGWSAEAAGESSPVVNVRMATDEPDAAVAILRRLQAGETVGAEAWSGLFATEGYRRLQQRERSMGREFEDGAFREFLASAPVVASTSALAATVEEWKGADLTAAAGRALAYLPAGARFTATIYPVIKPQSNSFVFEVETNPAIFMFVDPQISRSKLENTLAHELHHIGYAAACPDPETALPERVRTAATWAGAFGEGLAMLAAAGGPDVHPHAVSPAEERERWDRDVANVEADLRRVESFFLDVIEGRLTDPDAIRGAAMTFFGVQGPWYTVGWKMAATIEKVYGRGRLISVICEPPQLLATYNAAAAVRNAAADRLPVWSPALLAHFEM